MRPVLIAGSGIITALGNLDTTWSALLAGKSGIAPCQLPDFPRQWPLARVDNLTSPFGSSKRLEELIDLLTQTIPTLPADTPLICATTKGAPDQLLVPDYSPTDMVEPAELFKKYLSLSSDPITVSAACASGTLAISQAAIRIASGECEAVLIAGVDLISRFVLAGFASLQALSETGCRPFDVNRDGLSLGEGAGWMLITSKEYAASHNYPTPGRVTGWGTSCDATHITAPCRQASGLKAAINRAVSRADCNVGGINGHGTGTIYNDAMELLAFEHCFQETLPVHSVKGALGHCLGAAGIIEAAISLKSLEQGVLPPTPGLVQPEPQGGILSGISPLSLHHPAILSCNSGFGGVNSALVLESA